jgi:hypothetical protein
MLRDEGLNPSAEDYGQAMARVRAAFARSMDAASWDGFDDEDRGERLVIQGLKALGMEKNKAESLYDFAKKARKRAYAPVQPSRYAAQLHRGHARRRSRHRHGAADGRTRQFNNDEPLRPARRPGEEEGGRAAACAVRSSAVGDRPR